MNAHAKDPVIQAMGAAVDQASIGVSWANDRLDPMIQAIVSLATFTSDDAAKCNTRLKLICDIANETGILVNDMAGCFEREQRDLEEKLAELGGGSPTEGGVA